MATRINIGSGEVPLPAGDLQRGPGEAALEKLDRLLMFGMDVSTSLRARMMARRRSRIERRIQP